MTETAVKNGGGDMTNEDIPVGPRSAYAPIRFQATRGWWKDIGLLAARQGGQGPRQIADFQRLKLHPALAKAMRLRLGLSAPSPGLFQNEMLAVGWFGDFLADGRVIYDVNPDLASVLAHAPFDDSAVRDLTLLEGTSYFHFGKISELLIDGVQYEGAFALYRPRHNMLSVYAVQADAFDAKPLRLLERDKGEILPVYLNDPDRSLASALVETEREILEKNRRMIAETRATIESLKAQYGAVDFDEDLMGRLTAPLPKALYDTFVRMILGSYAYLASAPDDMADTWPADIPARHLEKMRAAANMAKEAVAQKALDNEGYCRLKYVGRAFAASHLSGGEQVAETHIPGKRKATHVRDYHWRNQAYGKEFSLRRPVLIRRTIVNPGGSLGAGRVFDVGADAGDKNN
jgi:hypothetical protein